MTTERLPRLTPDQLDESQQSVYEAMVRGPRGHAAAEFPLVNDDGSLAGPFNALVMAGDLGAAIQNVGEAIRFHGTLPPQSRELAILLVARSWRCDFEWYAHEPIGRRSGLSDHIIESVHAGEPPELDDPKTNAVHEVTIELLSTKELSDSTFEAGRAALGDRQFVELVSLVGYYGLLAGILNAFEVGLPESVASPFR